MFDLNDFDLMAFVLNNPLLSAEEAQRDFEALRAIRDEDKAEPAVMAKPERNAARCFAYSI